MEAKNTPQENKIKAEESKTAEVKPEPTPATTDATVADVDATTTNKDSKQEGEVGNEKEGEVGKEKEGEVGKENPENSKQQFNNKGLEITAKTLNKTNFSRSRELADKYANQLIDSAERFGKKISIDKIKEKLGEDLFRNLKQTSLKYFFDFLSKYSNTSMDIINDVFKSASIDLEEDGFSGLLSAKNRMRGNILLMFLLDRLNFALTNPETRQKLLETTELLKQFTNETFMAIITTLRENKELLEQTMEQFRPIIKQFIVTTVSALIQGLMVAIAASGPVGAPANLFFQGTKVINEVAPKLGRFSENVGNIIEKYDKLLASLSNKGEGPLNQFKQMKEKVTDFTDMIASVTQDAALIDAMSKTA
jgi:hypothetical protein